MLCSCCGVKSLHHLQKSLKSRGNLFNEIEDIQGEEENESEDAGSKSDDNKPKKKRGKRKRLPEFLPRIDNIIEPDEKKVFDEKGIELECIGEEVSEKLQNPPRKSSSYQDN